MKDYREYYYEMLRIRRFEEMVLKLFGESRISGTTHTYIGQEATAVALMGQLGKNDIVFSNHRCHGQFLAYGGPMEVLLSEIMAKETGMCKGIGGSQHIHYKNFYTNGVQGGIVSNAAGMAWAEKMNESDNIAVVFVGDGTLGQGTVYETMNLSSILSIPILFVIEDNGYAMTTPSDYAVSGSMRARPMAFGIETDEITSNDVCILSESFCRAISFVRSQKKPFCQIVHTYRLGAHSKGDDSRPKEEIEQHRKNDPLIVMGTRLSDSEKESAEKKAAEELSNALDYAERQQAVMPPTEGKADYHHSVVPDLGSAVSTGNLRCSDSLNHALSELLESDPAVYIFGEDVREPYGGCFKVTKHLSERFPDRIVNMPISEASMIGLGVGLALNHKKPIVEMMFGDFITLGFDQILNHAAKYSWMYAGTVQVPLVVRVPMGAGRGYGPTHSQSLEKYFAGMPGVTVVALSDIFDSGELLKRTVRFTNSPVLFVENKKMYGRRLCKAEKGRIEEFAVTETKGLFPTVKLSLAPGTVPDAVVVTYGGMTLEAMEAAKTLLMDYEVQMDVIIPSQLSPYPMDDITQLARGARIIGTMEEGNAQLGWGAEIIARLSEQSTDKKSYYRIASADVPIPCSVELEKSVISYAADLVKQVAILAGCQVE